MRVQYVRYLYKTNHATNLLQREKRKKLHETKLLSKKNGDYVQMKDEEKYKVWSNLLVSIYQSVDVLDTGGFQPLVAIYKFSYCKFTSLLRAFDNMIPRPCYSLPCSRSRSSILVLPIVQGFNIGILVPLVPASWINEIVQIRYHVYSSRVFLPWPSQVCWE